MTKLDLSYVEGEDSVGVAEQWASIKRYEVVLSKFKETLCNYFEANLLVGNGIDEFIDLLMLVTKQNRRGSKVLIISPAYGRYEQAVTRHGLKSILTDRYKYSNGEFTQIPLSLITEVVDRHKPSVVLFSNPGNPTPDFYSREDIVKLVTSVPKNCLVVIDEAFIEYAAPTDSESSKELINSSENLVVLRTFSKAYGLFGLRIGCLLCSKELAAEIAPFQRRYTIPLSSIEKFLEVYSRTRFKRYRLSVYKKNRSRIVLFQKTVSQLTIFSGVNLWFGATNFVLASTRKPLPTFINTKDISSKFKVPGSYFYRIRIPEPNELNVLLSLGVKTDSKLAKTNH